jgi:hypothetical protein
VWLGSLAATSGGGPSISPLHDTCNGFIDHFIVRGKGTPGQARAAKN